MERHEISTEKIDWPNLVRHVVRDRVAVELAEGELPIAMLIPIERPKTMADLDKPRPQKYVEDFGLVDKGIDRAFETLFSVLENFLDTIIVQILK